MLVLNFKKTIDESSLTQADVARRFGHSWQCIHNWYTGYSPVSKTKNAALIEYFKQHNQKIYYVQI